MKGQKLEPLTPLYSADPCTKATKTLWLTRQLLKSPSMQNNHCSVQHWTQSIMFCLQTFFAFYSLLPIHSNTLSSKISGYPDSVCCDCPWMVPVASWGIMAASLWNKHPLRKGERTITNQYVQLCDVTQRSGVDAASHFTLKVFVEELVFLRGWVSGCILKDWLWVTTKYYQLVMGHANRNKGRWSFVAVVVVVY